MAVVMQILGLAVGGSTPYDGEFLVEYDPERDGVSPDGAPMIAHIVTTADVAKARRFESAVEALECWRQVSQRTPMRLDGLPNRPLTAFTVETKGVEG